MENVVSVPEERLSVRLRQERQARGWSQQDVAERLADHGIHLHVSAIAKIEGGKRAVGLNEALAICSILGKSLDELCAPPTDEWNEVVRLLEQALASHRDGEALAARAFERLREMGADFGKEQVASMGRHPSLAPRVVELLARLEEFHSGEPLGNAQGK